MLETNVVDIAGAGMRVAVRVSISSPTCFTVQDNMKARKASYSAANPLALGVGSGVGGRSINSGVPSPIGWLTTKFAGVGAR